MATFSTQPGVAIELADNRTEPGERFFVVLMRVLAILVAILPFAFGISLLLSADSAGTVIGGLLLAALGVALGYGAIKAQPGASRAGELKVEGGLLVITDEETLDGSQVIAIGQVSDVAIGKGGLDPDELHAKVPNYDPERTAILGQAAGSPNFALFFNGPLRLDHARARLLTDSGNEFGGRELTSLMMRVRDPVRAGKVLTEAPGWSGLVLEMGRTSEWSTAERIVGSPLLTIALVFALSVVLQGLSFGPRFVVLGLALLVIGACQGFALRRFAPQWRGVNPRARSL